MTGQYEEKHAKRASAAIDSAFTDKATHLYRLVVRPDNSFEVYLDDKVSPATPETICPLPSPATTYTHTDCRAAGVVRSAVITSWTLPLPQLREDPALDASPVAGLRSRRTRVISAVHIT